jgi:hypothetical protein
VEAQQRDRFRGAAFRVGEAAACKVGAREEMRPDAEEGIALFGRGAVERADHAVERGEVAAEEPGDRRADQDRRRWPAARRGRSASGMPSRLRERSPKRPTARARP